MEELISSILDKCLTYSSFLCGITLSVWKGASIKRASVFHRDPTMTIWVSKNAFIEIIVRRTLPLGLENCIHLAKIASIYMRVWAHFF